MSARKDNTGKARERLSPAPAANIEYRRALASLRREAAVEIDRLIAFLDRVAPDPDLEEGDRRRLRQCRTLPRLA